MIACVAVPYFAAQVERRDDHRLARTPLAIGGQPWEPAPIFAFSREVARRGVRPGIPLRLAHILAPQAHFMPAHPPHYRQTSGELCQLLADFAPRVEPLALWQAEGPPAATACRRTLPAHYLLDLGDVPAREVVPFARQIGQAVCGQARLTAAVGVAAHRFTAQVAATVARPRHVRPVAAGEDGRFLHAYPLRFLPLDRETGRRCRLLGIRTLGDLAALPPAAVRTQFGAEMARLQRWAQGRDETPIQPQRPEQAETIAYCFDEPLTTREPLDRLLDEAARALAARLQAAARQAGRLSLLLETESGAHTLRQTFRQPTWTAGHLAETLRQLVAAHAFDAGLVAFRVSLAGLVPVATQQLALFAPPADLRQAFAGARRVAAKYPSSRFYQAALADPHPLPERRFRLHPLPHDAAVA